MNLRAITLISVILFVIPLAGSSNSSGSYSFTLEHSPGFVFNEPNNTSMNLSSIGMGFISYNGIYLSSLSNSTWSYSEKGNTSASYMSVIKMQRFSKTGYENITEYLPFNLSNSSLFTMLSQNGLQDIGGKLFNLGPEEINVTFYANLSLVNDSTELTVFTNNSTSSYARANYTELELTFSFSLDSSMPGMLFMEQLFFGYFENVIFPHFGKVFIGHGTSSERYFGLKLGFEKSRFSSYYWWNNNYSMNDEVESLTNLTGYGSGWASVVFLYRVPLGVTVIKQDPYFMVPSYAQPSSIGPLPVPPVVASAVNYFAVHIAYFIAGLMISGILLGTAYGIYRRRRIF